MLEAQRTQPCDPASHAAWLERLARRKERLETRPEPPGTKCCTKCSETKPRAAFHRERNSKDGRRGECAACKSARQRVAAMTPEQLERRRASNRRHDRKRRSDPIDRLLKAMYMTTYRSRKRLERSRQRVNQPFDDNGPAFR